MEAVNQIFIFIGKLLGWWFTVMPWEQAIHVKRGKKARLRGKGLYFKIPFVDSVFIQTVRTRMIDVPVQTVTTTDGKSITIKSTVNYSIGDMYKLYNTISHPENSLSGMVMSGLSEFIRSVESKDATPGAAEKYINGKINAAEYGLKDISIRITSWADVKTFRLIQDHSGFYEETLKMYDIDYQSK